MLSLAKLRVGQEAYQLSGVAQSLDDYYTGAGEAAGVWIGVGAEALNLSGEVAPDDLRAVLAGMAPGSGGLTPNGETIRPHPRRVPGFDLTFKVPKSVSVLYAVSDDPRVQGAIVEAGEAAVRQAIGWLEREAIHVRRGTGNEAFLDDLAARDPDAAAAARIRTLPGRGVVAAAFRHRTSRAGDPLLHWHTLVANLVEGPDGRWSAFVHPDLYRAARAAGEVFQTVLRAELTRRLGLEWRPGRHVPEVAGVPQALCDLFSKRSRDIEEWLAATGTPGDPAGRQAAVLATRRHKPEVEHERFDAAWKDEAIASGWGPEHAEALVADAAGPVLDLDDLWHRSTDGPDPSSDPEPWIEALCRDLTETDSTFTRPQLIQAVASRLGEGATMAALERVIARTLASPHLVPVGDDGERWTSAELLNIERRFLTTVRDARGRRRPLPRRAVERAATGRLGPDQAAAARTLAASRDAVSVLVGPAGTGKTYTLDAVRRTYEHAGYRVQGVAPSARAAHELRAGAGIDAVTIHRLLGSWSRGYDRPDRHTLLVVDEAAMAGSRELETLVTGTVRAGGRVLLVGDHHQLPEVTAGGGFAALASDPNLTVAELTVNRRQDHAWERDALAQLRDGHVAAAVAAYRDNGRVVAAPDRATMLVDAVDRWLTAQEYGLNPVLIAGTNDTVDALNHTMRRTLAERGLLGAHLGTWAGRDLAAGDRIVLRINDYRAVTTSGSGTALLNGHAATVCAAAGGGVVVRRDHDDAEILLDATYLDAGGVDHGYALTAHRAQGGTWDLSITVGAEGLYREAGYLVLSRGRAENWLLLSTPELDDLDAELARHDSPIPLPSEEPDDIDAELHQRLTTSRAKLLALTYDPHADAVSDAAACHDLATLEALAAHARAVERRATAVVGIDPTRTVERVERALHTARHAAVGHTVKALDRNNIGTITAVDDHAGTVEVRFTSAAGQSADRTFAWGDVRIVAPHHPEPRPLTATAQATIEATIAPDRDRIQRWQHLLADHDVAPDDRHIYETAARVVIDRAAARLAAVQPRWLTHLLGPRPAAPAAAQVWDDTVHLVAAHRVRHHVDDLDRALGTAPADPAGARLWDDTHRAIAEARLWLDTHAVRPVLPPTRTRSLPEIQHRLDELDAIFATAPADHRPLIDQLRSGQLAFENVGELLTDALAAQGERRRWILEHWPHVVEHHQITHTLEPGAAGPEPDQLLQRLATNDSAPLASAVARGDRWLVRLASQLTLSTDDGPRHEAATLLAEVAAYRQRWDISHGDLLGPAATSPEQAAERSLLTTAVDHAYATAHPAEAVVRDDGALVLYETLER